MPVTGQSQIGQFKILLTGAAGRIGTTFFNATKDRYTFRLADRTKLPQAPSAPHETMLFDLADAAACQNACTDIHTVIHLGGNPSPDADFHESLLQDNIAGTFNLFRAAKDQGCQRVIVASSAQAVEGYPVDRQVTTHMGVRPKNPYGVSKCFAEALAAYFAFTEGLPSIAVRIGAFERPEQHNLASTRDLSAFLSPRDMCQLLSKCIETESVTFLIAHGVSNNRFKRLDLSETRAVLGYAPQDDAFAMFDISIDTLTD